LDTAYADEYPIEGDEDQNPVTVNCHVVQTDPSGSSTQDLSHARYAQARLAADKVAKAKIEQEIRISW
jgi:hypothetical protein